MFFWLWPWLTWSRFVDGAQLALTAAIPLTIAVFAWLRRPSVKIQADKSRNQSRVEGTGEPGSPSWPYVRLLARNKRWRRASHGTRIIVEGYRPEWAKEFVTLGSPGLMWTSARKVGSGGLSIFPGLRRPVDFGFFLTVPERTKYGRLQREEDNDGAPIEHDLKIRDIGDGGHWEFQFAVSDDDHAIRDERHRLQAGSWVVRLTIGSDESMARTYDVHFTFKSDTHDPSVLLADLLSTLKVRRVWRLLFFRLRDIV